MGAQPGGGLIWSTSNVTLGHVHFLFFVMFFEPSALQRPLV